MQQEAPGPHPPAVRGLDRPLPTWEEQLLCVGSTFQVAATNGRDPARRVNIQVSTGGTLLGHATRYWCVVQLTHLVIHASRYAPWYAQPWHAGTGSLAEGYEACQPPCTLPTGASFQRASSCYAACV
jgi:hypothetical protein